MSRRFLTSLGALAVVALLAVPVMGQAPAPTATPGAAKAAAPAKTATSAKAKTANFTPPKTAWGDPNLQGVYNYATSTPMQRPRALGEKDVLTDDEAAELQKEKRPPSTRISLLAIRSATTTTSGWTRRESCSPRTSARR
jgi:hypothetical protein